jgi:hypothetical protein
MTPSASYFTSNTIAYNGLRFNSGSGMVLVSYLFDGTTYNLDSNNTFTTLVTGIYARALSPDGKYYLYG